MKKDETLHRMAIQRLRSMRASLDETAEEFGARIGVSGSTIRRWESFGNNAVPNATQLGVLCHTLGISPTWVLLGCGFKYIDDIERAIAVAQLNRAVDELSALSQKAERIVAGASGRMKRMESALEHMELLAPKLEGIIEMASKIK